VTAHTIAKTTSHRQRDTLRRYAPGTVGPYWVGRDRSDPSIFDRVNAEFWLIPKEQCTALVTKSIRGIGFPVQIEVADLHPFLLGERAPDPVTVVSE
jgi:hypothetical protein